MIGPQISLVMIVCNESLRLAHCLESVKNQVDEIIIVDTGSSDDTLSIAKQYTEKVYSYPWNDDFSSARNYALAHATCDWVLSLDADEQLHIQSTDLHSLIGESNFSAFCLPLYALKTSNDHLESDRFMVLRLFQRGYLFKGAVHEYLYVEDPMEVGYVCQPIIFHTPVSPTERYARRGRNIRLLQQALIQNSTDSYLQYYLGTEWLGVGRTHLAIGAFEKALRLFTPKQAAFRSPTIRHLINSYKDAGKLDEAICLCLQESQHYPDYCDLFFDGGVLFELKKEYEIASKWFQAALALPPPPLPFFHTDGTNGYLAYYHLGYCAEKLGLVKEAESYYEQALNNNNHYYYPLYQLILLKLTKESPSEVLSFLKKGDYLITPEVAEKISELFWVAGFPDISLLCLENSPSSTATSLEFSARYQLYSGKITLALNSINKLRDAGIQPPTELTVDEIIAHMILGNFNDAKKKLLTLWQMPSSRDVFRALFCLYKKMCHDALLPLSNQKAATTLLDLQNKCLRLGRLTLQQQQGFAALLKAIKELLTNDEKTFPLLLNHLYDKEKNLIQQLDYHCTAVRSFY